MHAQKKPKLRDDSKRKRPKIAVCIRQLSRRVANNPVVCVTVFVVVMVVGSIVAHLVLPSMMEADITSRNMQERKGAAAFLSPVDPVDLEPIADAQKAEVYRAEAPAVIRPPSVRTPRASGALREAAVLKREEAVLWSSFPADSSNLGLDAEYLEKERRPMVGVVDSEHLHGRIGVDEDGNSTWTPSPLRLKMTTKELEQAWEGYCFNTRLSKSLPMDRPVPDYNSKKCRREVYNYLELPKASVVIVFHNEDLSVLLRSVHSILNRSPPSLLREIILVDDNSNPETHPWLFDELRHHVKYLPKTRIRYLKTRHGLMMARMKGAEWAKRSDAVVFLDSHIECSPRYLEPMLKRIKEHPKTIVVPVIHNIEPETFDFEGHGIEVVGFSWALGQTHPSHKSSDYEPMESPVMAGGLLAADREWFVDFLEGYDPLMRLYGGEEFEIGFKAWMCGGKIEVLPCSRIGHVFRSSKYWKGQVYRVPGEEIHRNKLRVAAVWMDEYARIIEVALPRLPPETPLGDLGKPLAVRKKCPHSFQWYMDNVVPDMYVPKISDWSLAGAVENEKLRICLDTLGSDAPGSRAGAYPCHGGHGSQSFILDGAGHLFTGAGGQFDKCIVLRPSGIQIVSDRHCKDESSHRRWTYEVISLTPTEVVHIDGTVEAIMEKTFLLKYDGLCLTASKERDAGDKSPVSVFGSSQCSSTNPFQLWRFHM